MRLTCTNLICQTKLIYSEPVILGLFINGVNDMELQQDHLAEQNMTLNKAVTQAVDHETAKRSPGDPRHQPAGGCRHLYVQEVPEQDCFAARLLRKMWQ